MGLLHAVLIALVAIIIHSSYSFPESSSSSSLTALMGKSSKSSKDTNNTCTNQALVDVGSPCCNGGDSTQQCCSTLNGKLLNCFFFSDVDVTQLVSQVPVSNVLPCASGGTYCADGDKCFSIIDISNSGSPSQFTRECCSTYTYQDYGNDYNDVNQVALCSNNITCYQNSMQSSNPKYMCCSGDCNNMSSGSSGS